MDENVDELITRFRAGDGEAARQLYDRFACDMLGRVRALLGGVKNRGAFDSEGIVQDGFKSFFSCIAKPRFDARKGSLGGLLARIVTLKAYAKLRRKYPSNFSPDDLAHVREATTALLDANLTEQEVGAELRECINSILDAMTDREREVLNLYLDPQEERSLEEIARLCRRTVTTVEAIIERFITELQRVWPAPGSNPSGDS